MGFKTQHTERLILRPVSLADAPDLLVYHSDPDVVRFIPWPERDLDAVISAIEGYHRLSQSLADDGDGLVLAWALKSTGQVIGQSNMSVTSKANQTADLGWVLNPAFGGQGYAFEATEALLRAAFEAFGLHRVIASIDTRNGPSARLAEKLGMRLEGELKGAVWTKGEWCDSWLYAIVRGEVIQDNRCLVDVG